MGNSQQAGRLCEMLLEQAPACNWALDRDLSFHAVYGNAAAFFERPAAGLDGRNLLDVLPSPQHAAWRQRLDRVFGGEIVLFRERRPPRLFSVALYPLRQGEAV